MRSFRDPAGRLHFIGLQLIRQVYTEYASSFYRIVQSKFLVEQMASGNVVKTSTVEESDSVLKELNESNADGSRLDTLGNLFLRHAVVPFVSYPSEWPNEMLQAAAELTLSLTERGLDYGIGLKDATPYNILFMGPKPVFVDVLSFEERDPFDPVWLAHAQFVRTFILPLLANARLKFPLAALFLSRRDGIEPSELYGMLGPIKKITPPFLAKVTLPVWLSRKAEKLGSAIYRPQKVKLASQATFILSMMFKGMHRDIRRTGRLNNKGKSNWSDYCLTCTYDTKTFDIKNTFIKNFLSERRPTWVLDIGCNTGHFSRLAATYGAQVVAIDQDATVIGSLWHEAHKYSLDILPLVVDFARPTPALGWNNRETLSFLDRCRGIFDAVFMLALIHHLLVSDQIPLSKVLSLAAQITKRYLVIEYISPDDPQFKRLSRGRDALYNHLNIDYFESVVALSFKILHKCETHNHGRCLYVLEKINVK